MTYTSREVYEFISKQTNDPIVERKTCAISGQEFAIFLSEVKLLEKLQPTIGGILIELPLPTMCPEERSRRRNTYRNLTTLYHDQCDLTGRKIISRFHPDMNITVYPNDVWSSDKRSSTSYGMNYDESQSIVSHISTLLSKTPCQDLLGSLSNIENNATYTNGTADVKDCYLVFDSHDVEQGCYIDRGSDSKQVVDCLRCSHSERCYECVNCDTMFHSFFAYNCSGSSHCVYVDTCHGCQFCIGCTNLINKQYHLYNMPCTKDEFEAEYNRLQSLGWPLEDRFTILQQSSVHNGESIMNSEQCIGSNIRNAESVMMGSTCRNCSTIWYSTDLTSAQDCMDIDGYGHDSYLMYNSVQVGRYSNHIYFSSSVGKSEYLFYCFEVKKSHHCFGCVNMRDASYCIFNKQYTKNEREYLVPKLIQSMREDGSWGNFIDMKYSPFPYNDSDAQKIFPLDSYNHQEYSQVVNNDIILRHISIGNSETGILWNNKTRDINIPDLAITIEGNKLSSNITTIDDSIVDKVILCAVSGRPYRIIPMELEFYRKHHLPLPRKHPDVRHQERMNLRPGRTLYLRNCDKTGEQILSVYPPDYPGKVYSEKAYLAEVY